MVAKTAGFGRPSSAYFVDGTFGGTFLAPETNTSLRQVLFYSQDGLSPAVHTLRFNMNFTVGREPCMFVDFFESAPLPGSPSRGSALPPGPIEPKHDGIAKHDALVIASLAVASFAAVMASLCAVLLRQKIKLAKRRELGPSRPGNILERSVIRPFLLHRRSYVPFFSPRQRYLGVERSNKDGEGRDA